MSKVGVGRVSTKPRSGIKMKKQFSLLVKYNCIEGSYYWIRHNCQALWLVALLFIPLIGSAQTLRGDVNGDGKVDEADASALVNSYLKNDPLSTITDLDGDNNLTIADVVSLISMISMYNASGIHNGHDYVDLGLPSGTLWATCNMDADSPEQGGGVYAWGEIELKEEYTWDTYKWANGKPTKDAHNLTKYCDRGAYGSLDGKMTLEAADDVANVKWGGSWHIPTDMEFQELVDNCIVEWTRMNGIRGYRFTGSTGKNIFIPVGDSRSGTSVSQNSFEYWTSSLRPDAHGTNANNIERFDGELSISGSLRYHGQTIRPVISELKPIVHDETAPPSYMGHDLVDLGLPSGTLWATCNIGASSPEEYGCYYAWGETEGSCDGKESFKSATYKFYTDHLGSGITKYNYNTEYGFVDNLTKLEVEDDAAAANWRGEWRIPTWKQITELKNSRYTSWEWTTINGVEGFLVTSKMEGFTNNSIFLPAAGEHDASKVNRAGQNGAYLSSELDTDYEISHEALYLFFTPKGPGSGSTDRCYGRSVRPVVLLDSINK